MYEWFINTVEDAFDFIEADHGYKRVSTHINGYEVVIAYRAV